MSIFDSLFRFFLCKYMKKEQVHVTQKSSGGSKDPLYDMCKNLTMETSIEHARDDLRRIGDVMSVC